MNIQEDIIRWNKRYKTIPEPFYVVRTDEHFIVCTCDRDGNLLEEISAIHWDPWTVRRWAIEFAKKAKDGKS